MKAYVLPAALFISIAAGAFGLALRGGAPAFLAIALAGLVLLAGVGWWLAWARQRAAHRLLDDARRVLENERVEHRKEQEALQISQSRLLESERRRTENERRLDLVLNFNHSLVEARDEKSLMDAALSAITGLMGALGCSFVPVDEWEQPLPAFTYGQLPEPVLRAWATHLASAALRERCGNCSIFQSTPGGCPLHPQSIGNMLTVYCVALRRHEPVNGNGRSTASMRTLGILHIYLPSGRSLDEETHRFLEGMLQEIALAIETVRLRDQELSTLRQIQMVHAPQEGLVDSLGGLLEGLQRALEATFLILRLRPVTDERLSGLNVQRGAPSNLADAVIESAFERVLRGEAVHSPANESPAWLALPLRLPEGQVLGMLLVGRESALLFHPRQEVILQTVAAQAALLVENERILRSLEYRAVIQERTRLAREIHDGLAQTLAFLKLQAAQMQSYLAQGDMTRLAQVLKDNYQALAEAYLDTRQAIDNLRLTPREGLEAALEQIAADFEASASLPVQRSITTLSASWTSLVNPEVQAQMVRIVQEAFNNVRKHARARQAWITLREGQEELVLEVGDDGQGFDVGDVPEVSQHGLRGMRERAELIGADIQVISQPRQGTVVRLALPAYLKETSS